MFGSLRRSYMVLNILLRAFVRNALKAEIKTRIKRTAFLRVYSAGSASRLSLIARASLLITTVTSFRLTMFAEQNHLCVCVYVRAEELYRPEA